MLSGPGAPNNLLLQAVTNLYIVTVANYIFTAETTENELIICYSALSPEHSALSYALRTLRLFREKRIRCLRSGEILFKDRLSVIANV